jgi:hypothetical protein
VAADLELQYDVHGARDQADVRRVSPPVPVDAWQRAGVLDAWVREQGRWLGRVRMPDGRIAGSTKANSARRQTANRPRPTSGSRPAPDLAHVLRSGGVAGL